MDAFDYENDDFENDPSFTLNSDQETKLFGDNDDYDIIADAELIGLDVSPRKRRRRQQVSEDKSQKWVENPSVLQFEIDECIPLFSVARCAV